MNDGTSGSRGRPRPGPRRSGILAAALAGGALLATACSGGGSPAAAGTTAYQKTLAYSQCMRSHGEPGFPDPTSNGNLIIDGKKDHLNGALMQPADKVCRHLLPKSAPLTAARQRQLTSQALKFVACMRSHGLPSFSDPVVNASGVSQRLPRGVSPNSPQFQSAQQACRKFQPGGGP
jgi:hypothetical protein